VLSNQGAATLGLGKPEAAAKLFLEAAHWQPEDEQGKINEVLAFLLVGDLSTCHSKALLLRGEYPGSSRLAALWLNSAPKELCFTAAESQISAVLRTDPEVCVALARRALVEFAFDNAFKYASSASKSAPKWSQPQLVLAQISLGKAIHVQLGFQAESVLQETTLIEAEETCSRALDLAREEKDEQTEAVALVLRVDVRLLLKKIDDAVKDAEKAERLNPEDSGVMIAVAQVWFASGRTEDGMAMAVCADSDGLPCSSI
jgi:tetratricopeptide (TPR) repeat protein